jgi:hypothetical protein
MRDLMSDRPTRRGCGVGPSRRRHVSDEGIEFVAFGAQIGHHRTRSSHARTLAGPLRAAATATMNDIQNSESWTVNTCPRSASSTSICIAVSAHSFTT